MMPHTVSGSNIILKIVTCLFLSVLLAACGGGSDKYYNYQVVSGTAATGAPIIAGTITAICADGSGFASPVTTDNNGHWRGFLKDNAMPCALKVSWGTPEQSLYSYVATSGVVNITPITDLALALITNSTPKDWFDAFNGTPVDIVSATSDLLAALRSNGFTVPVSGSPFATRFAANGTGWDALLDQIQEAIDEDSSIADYQALVTLVKEGNLGSLPMAPEPSEQPETPEEPEALPNPTGNGAALNGGYGITGTVNGVVYTFTNNRIFSFTNNPLGRIQASNDAAAPFSDHWYISGGANDSADGLPSTPGIYNCTRGELNYLEIIFYSGTVASTAISASTMVEGIANANQGACRLEILSVNDNVIEGRFTARLVQMLGEGGVGTVREVTDGYFRIARSVPEEPEQPEDSFTISGSVSGISGVDDMVVWQLDINGAFHHDFGNGNGAVTFTQNAVANGSTWLLKILSEPEGLDCHTVNGSGTINGSNITDVQIICEPEESEEPSSEGTIPANGTATAVNSGLIGRHTLKFSAYSGGCAELCNYPDGQTFLVDIGVDNTLTIAPLAGGQTLSNSYTLAGNTTEIHWTGNNNLRYAVSNQTTGVFNEINLISGTTLIGQFTLEEDDGDGESVFVSDAIEIAQSSAGLREALIVGLENGGFVSVWAQGIQGSSVLGAANIFAQRYDATGALIGSQLQANSQTTSTLAVGSNTSVAALLDGGFVAIWLAQSKNASNITTYQVFGQRFDSAGTPMGDEFSVGDATGALKTIRVAGLSDGGYVVVCDCDFVRYQRYDAGGQAVGGFNRVNPNNIKIGSTFPKTEQLPSVIALKNGGFLVQWDQVPGSFGQRYDADGQAIGSQINFDTSRSLASLEDGGFVATWRQLVTDSDPAVFTVYTQHYTDAGVAVGEQRIIAQGPNTGNFPVGPSVASLADGGYIVTWGIFGDVPFGQRYNSEGAEVGNKFAVLQGISGAAATGISGITPQVAGLKDGGFVVTWKGNSNYGRVFGADFDGTFPVIPPTQPIDPNISGPFTASGGSSATDITGQLAGNYTLKVTREFANGSATFPLDSLRAVTVSENSVTIEGADKTLTFSAATHNISFSVVGGVSNVRFDSVTSALLFRYNPTSGALVLMLTGFLDNGEGGADLSSNSR